MDYLKVYDDMSAFSVTIEKNLSIVLLIAFVIV